MSNGFPWFLSPGQEALHVLRGAWVLFLLVGISLVVLGVLAIGSPWVATEAIVTVTGVLLVIGGLVEVGSTFFARGWGGMLLHLVCGLLYLFAGIIFLERPTLAAEACTLMLAVFFVFGGVIRIAVALERHFSGWGWTLFSGAVGVLLGILIWRQFPSSTLWVIGTFVGIDLVFNGWSWVMLALGVRSVATEVRSTLPAQ
jgi:uncharacterized membrane protein HdeD (DUF308 family)